MADTPAESEPDRERPGRPTAHERGNRHHVVGIDRVGQSQHEGRRNRKEVYHE